MIANRPFTGSKRQRTEPRFSELELWLLERLFTGGPKTAKQLALESGRPSNTIRPRLAELAAEGAVRVAGNVRVGKRLEQSWGVII
jgi:predicted ArsR family transcriptional regulator